MKNVLQEKKCNMGTVQVHVGPPPIPLIKSKNDDKSDVVKRTKPGITELGR